MRCFFHLVGPADELLTDDTGVEVASADDARAEALKAIDEIRREDPNETSSWFGWNLEIVDEAGEVISTIPLRTNFRRALIVDRVDGRPDPDVGPGRTEPH